MVFFTYIACLAHIITNLIYDMFKRNDIKQIKVLFGWKMTTPDLNYSEKHNHTFLCSKSPEMSLSTTY